VGYLSLDERNAFVRSVTASVRAAAESAGLALVECDSGWTREGVLSCAQDLGDLGVDGLLGFQPFADLAAQVCAIVGDVPTVGIVFDQGPCQVSQLRIDQAESGRLAGESVGRFAAERWDCETSAYLSLESNDSDPDGRARMAGYRAGYQEHCPLPSRTLQIDDADRLVTAQTQVARRLAGLQGRRIIVVGLNESAVLGAMAAASAAGRKDEVWYSGQLADASIREHIACDGQYIASVAQFPERYGEQLLPLLVRALDGEVVPDVVEAPLELVTAANVRQLFPDTPPCDD
jgi:ribose transport system substrate-binding protein